MNKCSECDKKITGEGHIVPNGTACDTCYDDKFSVCDSCQDTEYLEDLTFFSDQYFCESCADRDLITCDDCNSYEFKNDSYTTASNNEICNSCRNNNYTRCYNCDDLEQSDDLNYCDSCEEYLCSGCSDDHGCDNDRDERDYSMLFESGKPCALLGNNRFMGVEIEVENPGSANPIDLESPFGVTNDGSLSNGQEVTTPPASGTAHVKYIKQACKALEKSGYVIKPSCGLHAHIDLRDKQKDFKYLAHLLTTFYAIEDVLFAMQPNSRQDNHYCQPLRKDYKFFDFYGKKYIKDFDYTYYKVEKMPEGYHGNAEALKRYGRISSIDLMRYKQDHYNSYRYYGVNFHSVFYRGTLELRMHAGSMNPIKIIRWCDLIQKIVEWVDKSYSYETVAKLLLMDVTPEKLKLMKRVFKLSKPTTAHINTRIKQFNHYDLKIPYTLGKVPTKQCKKFGVKPQPKPKKIKIVETPIEASTLTLGNLENAYTAVRNTTYVINWNYGATNPSVLNITRDEENS